LPDDTDDFFHHFHQSIANFIQDIYPQDEVKLVTIGSMVQDVLSLAGKKQVGKDAFIVSTCVDFAVPKRGRTLEVNRLVDGSGKIIGIGTRPGHEALDTQCAKIARLANNKPVIIVEDGIFSGETIEHIVNCLRQNRVNVTNVVACFAFPEGMNRLNATLKGIELDYAHDVGDLIDWVPDHDFFPGAPNCGRVVGTKVLDLFMPFYDRHGSSFSFPYITPFSPMAEWASIPNAVSHSLASFCLRSAAKFFEKLDIANGGKQVTFAELQGVNPRISVPIAVNSSVFPDKFTGVSGYLNRILVESY
jgi:hypothetical protein